MENNNTIGQETFAEGEFDALSGISDKRAARLAKERFEASALRMHKNHKQLNRTLTAGFLIVLAAVIVAALAMRQFIFEPTLVEGESMEQYLMNSERVGVSKAAYWFHEPQRGDIVIVHYPNREGRFVKRIIAFGGETVSIKDGYVLINGKPLDESAYAGEWYGHMRAKFDMQDEYVVPEGYVFVMGDNREVSHDSRSANVGPIAKEQVLGKAFAVIWPLSKLRGIG